MCKGPVWDMKFLKFKGPAGCAVKYLTLNMDFKLDTRYWTGGNTGYKLPGADITLGSL